MATRGDEVKVGAVVLGSGAILIITILLMMHYNPFHPAGDEYLTRLKFAGGLERDSIVRLGGVRCGKVMAVRLAPENKLPVEVVLRLRKGTAVRTDSVARIAALNALGENYVEISPGNEKSPLLLPGRTIPSSETAEFSELLSKFSVLSDDTKQLITDLNKNINQISSGADKLLGNLNEMTGPKNQQSLSTALSGANGMISNANDLISRSAPKIDAIASNLKTSSEQVGKLLERIDETTARMNRLLENVDGTVTENRPQVKKDLEAIELTLADARKLLAESTAMLESNRGEIDTMLEEFRRASENMREFTDTIKQRPFSLVRVKAQRDRKVPK